MSETNTSGFNEDHIAEPEEYHGEDVEGDIQDTGILAADMEDEDDTDAS